MFLLVIFESSARKEAGNETSTAENAVLDIVRLTPYFTCHTEVGAYNMRKPMLAFIVNNKIAISSVARWPFPIYRATI